MNSSFMIMIHPAQWLAPRGATCYAVRKSEDDQAMRKPVVFRALFILLLGFPPFINSLSNPRLAGLHVPDRLQLIAVGFCFGVAFGALVGARKFS